MANTLEEELASVDVEIIDLANNMLKHLMTNTIADTTEDVNEALKRIIAEKGQDKYDGTITALNEYYDSYQLRPIGFVEFASDNLRSTFVDNEDIYDDDFDEAYRLIKSQHKIVQIGKDRGMYTLIMQKELLPGGTPEPVVEVEEEVEIVMGDWGEFDDCLPKAKAFLASAGGMAKEYSRIKTELYAAQKRIEDLEQENRILKISSWQ